MNPAKVIMVTSDDIRAALPRIAPYIQRTPVLTAQFPGLEYPVQIKLENCQITGSFKARGAFNTLLSHRIEIHAVAGEHVRLRCTNAMPTAGWLMMMFLHVTALSVRLERE